MMSFIRHPMNVAIVLIAIALIYLLWFGLTQRGITQDEGISILAAQGISETGQPRLPSGFLYVRGYLPHYLVGVSILGMGLNQFSIMLPSLVLGLGSLFLVYAFGKDVMKRPWAGVIAVAILILLPMQAFYATSPRMYMGLQFFTVLTAYSAWRGYIEGDTKFKILTVVATLAALLSHKQALALVPAIPMALIAVTWWKHRSFTPILSIWHLVAWLVVIAASVSLIRFVPADATPHITAFNFATKGILGLRLNPLDWLNANLGLREIVLYSFGFIPIGLFVLIALIRRKWLETNPIVVYMLLIATISAGVTILAAAQPTFRMWFSMFPLYALLIANIVLSLIGSYGQTVKEWLEERPASRLATVSILIIGAFVILGAGSFALGPRYTSIANKVIGPPCQGDDCNRLIKEHYIHLESQIQPNDVIISSNPFVTAYYLGRVDGYLRDKVIINLDGTEERFDYLEDEYFKIPLMDASDLQAHLANDSRVIVISDIRTQWISNEETQNLLRDEYEQFRSDEVVTTYINCMDSPCNDK